MVGCDNELPFGSRVICIAPACLKSALNHGRLGNGMDEGPIGTVFLSELAETHPVAAPHMDAIENDRHALRK